ncbi:MerR family transcriptional regulator [Paenibacillus sp. IB182496]|uniref:MerR family transcriptional regulator n=1 Tax=Paenibacillus sabuli TaxID=2772509 RepID=A0A927GTQ6_9BACL|nr:MerR family transcriptional regulator [Paenibacillus sabuli]MBD2847546.1 MerR family transcriptional regulator [Paenibacillus sabuli]
MEYTVQKLARLAGVSARTLRYYDEIGLLKPARVNSSGYRIYGPEEVDLLQQIRFYCELGVKLEDVRAILASPEHDALGALRSHREHLLNERRQLDALIRNLERTLAVKEGRGSMTDDQKFEGFKKKMVEDNEAQYGGETRSRYGDEVVEQANAKLLGMTKAQHEEQERLTEELYTTLAEAVRTGDPASEQAQRAAELHKQWLSFYWPTYTKEAHAGVAQMYVDDPRFTAHYDAKQPGTAVFLRDAVRIFTST